MGIIEKEKFGGEVAFAVRLRIARLESLLQAQAVEKCAILAEVTKDTWYWWESDGIPKSAIETLMQNVGDDLREIISNLFNFLGVFMGRIEQAKLGGGVALAIRLRIARLESLLQVQAVEKCAILAEVTKDSWYRWEREGIPKTAIETLMQNVGDELREQISQLFNF